MNCVYHVEDPRQRVADYAAVLVLTRAAAEEVEVSIAQLGAIVAAYLPMMEPDKLRAWSEQELAQAVRTIKLDLLRHQITLAEAPASGLSGKRNSNGRRKVTAAQHTRRRKPARTSRKLSEWEIARLDEEISQAVVANFFKFMTMSTLYPEWFIPYLEETTAF